MMSRDKSLVMVAFYAALIGALGILPMVAIPILGGVPISAQTLGVMLAGVMLGATRGALAVLLFLLLVMIGAPLLAGGRGGLGAFMGPSVGFLIGWPFGAFVAGWLMHALRGRNILFASAVSAFTGGVIVVYAFGAPGIAIMAKLPLWSAFLGSAIYIPGDIIKVAITAVVAQTIARGMPSALLSRQ